MLKWIITLVLVLGLAGTGLWFWKHPGDKGPEYRTAEVTRGDLTNVVSATGQLNPVVNVQVGSQVSGIISKLYADYNSPVTNGQIIAQLDPATFKAARDQAAGDLENSKAALELSQVEARRAEELHKSQLISQSDYDKAQADLHQAQANVMIKQAALQRAQVDLDRATIYAPVDGVVISRNVDVGQTVAASLSAPTLFIIANDLSKMQIDAAVSEADVGGIEEGQLVHFMVDAYPNRTFRGTVAQVRNAAVTNQNVITYDTVISVNNKDQKLKPGMTATVSIIVTQKNEVLKIPNSALRFRPAETTEKKEGGSNVAANTAATTMATAAPGGARTRGAGEGAQPGAGAGAGAGMGRRRGEHVPVRTVYTLAAGQPEGEAKLVPVQIKTGISDGTYTEVTEGLKEGDVVVTGVNVTTGGAESSRSPFGGGGFRRF